MKDTEQKKKDIFKPEEASPNAKAALLEVIERKGTAYTMRVLNMAKNYYMNVDRIVILSEVYGVRWEDVAESIERDGYYAEKLRYLKKGLVYLWCELDNHNRENLVKAIRARYADEEFGTAKGGE